jgi:hypothetical protein
LQAVAAAPNIPNAEAEMDKFILLPEKADHSVPIFPNVPVVQHWPVQIVPSSPGGSNVQSNSNSWSCMHTPEFARMHLHLPTPTEDFMGRNVEMYHLIVEILQVLFYNLHVFVFKFMTR